MRLPLPSSWEFLWPFFVRISCGLVSMTFPYWIILLFWWHISLQEFPENECLGDKFFKTLQVCKCLYFYVWLAVLKIENSMSRIILTQKLEGFAPLSSQCVTEKAGAITLNPQEAFEIFSIFLFFSWNFTVLYLVFCFFFKLFVNTWWAFQCLETVWGIFLNDFFYDFINSFWNFLIKFSRGRFLYRSFKFLDFLFLLSISVIFLSWFWESSSTLLLDEFLYVFLFPLSYF